MMGIGVDGQEMKRRFKGNVKQSGRHASLIRSNRSICFAPLDFPASDIEQRASCVLRERADGWARKFISL